MPAGQPRTSFRPRSAYLGHPTVGSGDGAVLIRPEVASELRAMAGAHGLDGGQGTDGHEQGEPGAFGLLYGRNWHDEAGRYTVIDGFVAAGPRQAAGDADADADVDVAALSARLQAEGASRYPNSDMVGWWRAAPPPGVDDPADAGGWPMGHRPDGVGLVVFPDGATVTQPHTPAGDRGHTVPSQHGIPAAVPAMGPAAAAVTAAQVAPPAEPDPASVAAPEAVTPPIPPRYPNPATVPLSPNPTWRPGAPRRRPPEEREPWWREAHRVVAVIIAMVALAFVIGIIVLISPLL